MAGSSDGAAAAPNTFDLAHTILQALSASQLGVEERAAICAGVLRSLARRAEGPTDLLVDVAALPNAADVQQRVEASWLVLEQRLRAAAPAIDEAVVLEARRWIETVALPVVRSGRPEVQPACDFIGLNAIGALAGLCGEQGGVRACVEAATLQLLEDVAAGRGTEESVQVLAARMRWIAAYLAASGEAGVVPLPVVQRFLSIVRHHPLPSMRATAILGICPALVEILRRDATLCMDAWGLIVELDGLGLLDHQRDAFAMLCVLYDCIRPLLIPQDRQELWRLLYRGLSCEGCSAVRKRSLFILGQELELAGVSEARGHPTTVWWTRFLSAYDTLENVLETHLLQQVFPIVLALVEEAFGAEQEEGAAAHTADGPLPTPSAPWAELLLQRVFHSPNYPVQRVYLRWFFAQSRAEPAGEGEPQVVLDVNCLSEDFVLGHLLPALQELGNMREEREALLQDIARFLAAYVVGRQEREGAEGCRRFLRALLAYTRDGTNSAPVRMALLGFVEQHDVLARAQPCLGGPELDLARSALAAFLEENNQAVGHRLAAGVLACCERFTDRAAVAAAPGGAESVRALLLELPLKLSLHTWRERIGRWLEALGGGGGDELAWWRAATARGVEALLSSPDSRDETTASSSSTSCALACFFLHTPDDMHAALASCVHVLERLHSHPYVPPHAQRAALTLLRHLAVLLRQAPHAALGDTLRPCLGEPIEFLVAAIVAAMGDDSSSADGAGEALFRFHVDVLGASLGLAAQLGCTVASSVLGLVETSASRIGGDDAAASTVAGRRAVLVLRSLLESLVQNDGRPGSAPALALAIGERFDSLKRCLDAAATRRPPTNMAGFSEYVSNVWRCRALLFRLQGIPSLRQRLHIDEELELLLAAVDTAGEGSLQDVLFCLKCGLAPYVLGAPDAAGRYARLDPIVNLLLRCMDEANYTRGVASLCIDMVLDAPFLADATFCEDADGPVRRFFARVVRVSTTKKAYLLVDVAARLVAVLRRIAQQQQAPPSSPPPALYFVEELVQLLTMREQEVSIQHRADEGEQAPDALLPAAGDEDEEGQEKEPDIFPFVRMTVLSFLTDLFRDAAQQPVLDRLLLALFDWAAAVDTRKTQIAGSPAFSVKLRAWQALAVLAPFVHAGVLPEVNARLYGAMHVVTLPQIRWHMEMLNAYLCMRYPSVGVPLLVERIRTVDVRPQVSASLLVVVGLLCLTKETLFEGDGQLPEAFVLPVLKAVLPWLSGTHVTTRVICQMVAFRLLSRARAAGLLANGGLDEAYLNGTLDFLEGNREMSILRRKELRRFEAVSVPRSCSVAGVMGHAFAEGEFTATHLEITLRESMTELIKQMEEEDAYPTIAPPQAKRDLFALHSDVSSARSLLERTGADATYSIQKKIVVSDVLQGLPREEPKRFENARGEPLQDIVICASLLDRLPNLAGLARTCEIFAARTLAIPDLRVTKEAMFQSISSSAERWVPMVQVKDTGARHFLRRMKRDGYTVVGLEQTSTSRCLTRVELPRRMLLLLGREKEGVPVELLAEVDMLVEIPQLGLVRSLNVHVSASLILWEYTRQHRFAGPVGCGVKG